MLNPPPKSSSTRWLFLGDESRRLFVSWILRVPLAELDEIKSLTIRRGERPLEVSRSDDDFIASTYFLPPETEIYSPTYSDELSIKLDDFDNCAVFEMFPFCKESTEDLARLIESNKKLADKLIFVLVDVVQTPEGQSSCDLNSGKMNLLRKNRDVIIARDEGDILKVLHWHRPLAANLVKQIRRELRDISASAKNIFADYDQFIAEQVSYGCLSERVERQIVSFETVRGKDHIWRSYVEAALKVLLPTKSNVVGLGGLIDLYARTLYGGHGAKNFAAFVWEVSSDCESLRAMLGKRFVELIRPPKKFQSFMTFEEYNSEHIYNSIIRGSGRFAGIAESFLAAYENFVRVEAQEILIAELDRHIQKLKGMIR